MFADGIIRQPPFFLDRQIGIARDCVRGEEPDALLRAGGFLHAGVDLDILDAAGRGAAFQDQAVQLADGIEKRFGIAIHLLRICLVLGGLIELDRAAAADEPHGIARNAEADLYLRTSGDIVHMRLQRLHKRAGKHVSVITALAKPQTFAHQYGGLFCVNRFRHTVLLFFVESTVACL